MLTWMSSHERCAVLGCISQPLLNCCVLKSSFNRHFTHCEIHPSCLKLVFQVEGRNLIDIFMVLPSKKDYPDYYQVISEPVDMTMIDAKIKAEKVRHQRTYRYQYPTVHA